MQKPSVEIAVTACWGLLFFVIFRFIHSDKCKKICKLFPILSIKNILRFVILECFENQFVVDLLVYFYVPDSVQ